MYQTVPSLRMFLRIYSDPSKIQIFLQPPKISPQPAQLKMLWPMTCGLQFLHHSTFLGAESKFAFSLQVYCNFHGGDVYEDVRAATSLLRGTVEPL